MIIKTATEKQCHRCRNWDDCAGKEHYTIHDITFCRYQVQWLIGNFFRSDGDDIVLERESWPAPVRETGYTEAPRTSHSISTHAPFERPMQVIGELDHRLKKAGKDGRLLVLEVHLEQAYDTTRRSLSSDARAALGYISGWRRKRLSYSRWRTEKKRSKNTQKSVFTPPY
jgi:hypothetical protein